MYLPIWKEFKGRVLGIWKFELENWKDSRILLRISREKLLEMFPVMRIRRESEGIVIGSEVIEDKYWSFEIIG